MFIFRILVQFPWVLDDDRLDPVGTDGNRGQRCLGQLADPLQVVLSVDRQVLELLDPGDVFIPTRQFFVNGFAAVQFLQAGWVVVDLLTIQLVGGADLDGLQTSQDVQQVQAKAGQAGYPTGVAHGHTVKPANPPWPPGDGPVFVTGLADLVTDLVGQFGWEWAGTDPGGVSLADTDNRVDLVRAHADPGADTPGDWVGGGDVWVGPLVDVQHYPLSPFEEDLLALVDSVVDDPGRVGDVLLQFLTIFIVAFEDVIEVDRVDVVELGEELILLGQVALQLDLEGILFEQVTHPNPDPGDLVHVGWTDPVLGGADLVITLGGLLALVEQDVVWEGHVRPAGDPQAGNIDPIVLQIVEFLQQGRWVDDHPVTDDGQLVLPEDPGRHQPQGELLSIEGDGVTGVVPTLGTDNDVRVLAEVIGHLPLSFIAPLTTNNYN